MIGTSSNPERSHHKARLRFRSLPNKTLERTAYSVCSAVAPNSSGG